MTHARTQAPLPPRHLEPWCPRRELVDALHAHDAEQLQSTLLEARRELARAVLLGLLAVGLGLGGPVVLLSHVPGGESFLSAVALWLIGCLSASVGLDVLNSARALRLRAYRSAEVALIRRLAADEREARVLRELVDGGDAV